MLAAAGCGAVVARHLGEPGSGQVALHLEVRLLSHAREREDAGHDRAEPRLRVRVGRRSRASTSRRSSTSCAARSPTPTRGPAPFATRRSGRRSGKGLSCTSSQGMTANLVHGQEARDVSVFVGLCSVLTRTGSSPDPASQERDRQGPELAPAPGRKRSSRSCAGSPAARDRRPRASPAGRSAPWRSRRRRARASSNGPRDGSRSRSRRARTSGSRRRSPAQGRSRRPRRAPFIPAARIASSDASSRAAAASRAPSSSETQWRSGVLSAGVTTSTSVVAAPGAPLELGEELGAPDRLVRDHEQPLLAGRMRWRRPASRAPIRRRASSATSR